MKNNQFTIMLVGMLLFSVLASVSIMYYWQSYFKRYEVDQARLAEINKAGTIFQNLWNETAQYANTTKNPEMLGILNGAGGSTPATPAKPAK